jgi:hypothetical protein
LQERRRRLMQQLVAGDGGADVVVIAPRGPPRWVPGSLRSRRCPLSPVAYHPLATLSAC